MTSRKKIVMIGPVYPYKGGISHYTGLLYQSLVQKHDVFMMSYKLQYPHFLYKKEQRDYSNDTFKIKNTVFGVHTANPFNWISTARQIRLWNPDLVIIQWWHPYFAPCYWTICKCLRKCKILFLCHNVFPHERFPLDRFLTRRVLACGSFFIVQSTQDEMDLKSIKKDAIYKKTVHPTYNVFKFQNMTMEEGRSLLGLAKEERVLLFFGFVREYKGLKHLLRALPLVAEQMEHIKLLVVGDFADDKVQYLNLIKELGITSYVELYDGYTPDREVEKFFAAADLVVLPYESATQSGIVQIAYGFEKPVIATNVGGLPDVVLNNRTGYIVEAQNSRQLAERIISFFNENKAELFREGIRQEAYKYSWDRMREIIEGWL